jgi:hypothetical protein
MVAQREIFLPQAMQRHTGCAWVHPACAEDKTEKPKPDVAAGSRENTAREK